MQVIQEMGRNYIVAEDATEDNKAFMKRMITENKIEGLVMCEQALYENEHVLRYDVTGLKSLDKIYEGSEMQYENICSLIKDIAQTLQNGLKYLLEYDCYCLSPEYIYYDEYGGGIKLVYLPYTVKNQPVEQSLGKYYKLADFLLEKTNHKDERAVSTVYEFYRLSKATFFSVDEFYQRMENKVMDDDKNESEPENFDLVADEDDGWGDFSACAEVRDERKGVRNRFVRRLSKWRKSKKDKEVDILVPVTVDEYWSGQEATQFFDNERTQFFEDAAREYVTLSWQENGMQKEKVLTDFPVEIGKKYESVDVCILDPSISRRHARIIRRSDGLYIRDEASTNGTFVNGIKLKKKEEIKIDKSSEIQFGKVKAVVV